MLKKDKTIGSALETQAPQDPLAVTELLGLPDDSTASIPSRSGLAFYMQDELIYYKDVTDRARLCLPNSFEKEIFQLAHDGNSHVGFHRAYQRITETLYMQGLSRRLRLYIAACPLCQLNQTKRHRPYRQLVPIAPPPIPFHTIGIDFIMHLPSVNGFNTVLSITCKFTKRIGGVPGKKEWGAKKWARELLRFL